MLNWTHASSGPILTKFDVYTRPYDSKKWLNFEACATLFVYNFSGGTGVKELSGIVGERGVKKVVNKRFFIVNFC